MPWTLGKSMLVFALEETSLIPLQNSMSLSLLFRLPILKIPMTAKRTQSPFLVYDFPYNVLKTIIESITERRERKLTRISMKKNTHITNVYSKVFVVTGIVSSLVRPDPGGTSDKMLRSGNRYDRRTRYFSARSQG
jgi:hypothetical protein